MDKIISGIVVGGFGLFGVILGGLITIYKDYLLEKIKNRKHEEYLSIRVVCLLDDFIEQCANVVGDFGEPDNEGEIYPIVDHPNLNLESLDVNWKSIPSDLMYGILSFPQEIDRANKSIESIDSWPPDHSEFYQERRYQYSALGLKASDIATQLRNSYGLKNLDYENWNPIEYLSQKRVEILANRVESMKKQAAMNQELWNTVSGTKNEDLKKVDNESAT